MELHEARSLTSDSTSTKPTKLSASSANTDENVSVSYRLNDGVGGAADAHVVVDVHELPVEGIGEEPRHEERVDRRSA